jgi:hypothetical protein
MVMATGTKEYTRDYNRGWAAAGRGGTCREWESGTSSDAFDCGYLDRATGRVKWHLRDCQQHSSAVTGGCGQA